jgi:hypothetical protein
MYLHYVHNQAPQRIAGATPDQVARLTAGAARLVPGIDAALHATTSQLIVDGYVLVAMGCLIMAIIATVACVFVRYAGVAPAAPPILEQVPPTPTMTVKAAAEAGD